MNDIESIRDYFIADEIQRVKSLSIDQLVNELISINTAKIEALSNEGLIEACQKL